MLTRDSVSDADSALGGHDGDGIAALRLLARLAQQHANAPMLIERSMLGHAARIARLAAFKLSTLRSSDAAFGMWWNALAPILALCLSTIRGICQSSGVVVVRSDQLFTAAECVQGQRPAAQLYVSRVVADGSHAPSLEEKQARDVRASVLQLGFVRVACDALRFLRVAIRDADSVGRTRAAAVHQLLLDTACRVLDGSVVAQEAIRDGQLLEHLVQTLGRTELVGETLTRAYDALPSPVVRDGAAAGVSAPLPADFAAGRAALVRLEQIFSVQCATLDVLERALFQCDANSHAVTELGGAVRLVDTVLWVSEFAALRDRARWYASGAQAADDALGAAMARDARNPHRPRLLSATGDVADTVDADFYYLMPAVAVEAPASALLPPGIESLGELIADIDECPLVRLFDALLRLCVDGSGHGTANATVVNVVIDVFSNDIASSADNARARALALNEGARLAHCLVDFVARLVAAVPSAAALCTRFGLWRTLSSAHFFGDGVDVRDAVAANVDRGPGGNERLRLRRAVPATAAALVTYVGALDAATNQTVAAWLWESTVAFARSPLRIAQTANALLSLLQHRPLMTRRSLRRLKLPESVRDLLREMPARAGRADERNPDKQHAGGDLVRARDAVLAVAGYFGNCAPLGYDLLLDSATLDVYMALLTDRFAHGFVRSVLLSLIRLAPRPSVGAMQFADTDGGHGEGANERVSDKMHAQIDDALSHVCASYLGPFARPVESDADAAMRRSLLDGIRTVVEQHRHTQRVWRDAGAFIKVINLLSGTDRVAERDVELHVQQCANVLSVIAALLADNLTAKRQFRETIGYDSLRDVILRNACGGVPPVLDARLLAPLLDLLVDGRFSLATRLQIANADAIDLVLRLSIHFDAEQHQRALLSTLCAMLQASPTNRSLCCDNHAIFRLLELLPQLRDETLIDLNLRMVEVLGGHSITVRELKRFFSLLRAEQPGDFRPRCSDQLVRALHNMAERVSDGPARFFSFTSAQSALRLPNNVVRRFPDARGWSFAAWVRLNALSASAAADSGPRLLSFLHEDERSGVHGVEVYVTRGGVVGVRTLHGGGEQPPRVTLFADSEAVLQAERWYHVAITHQNQERLPWGKSEVRLYVDGANVGRAPLKYATFAELGHCTIGSSCRMVRAPAALGLAEAHSLDGQLSGIYVFDDCLSKAEVAGMFSLGPDYAGTFRDAGVLQSSTRLFLAYHSSATREAAEAQAPIVASASAAAVADEWGDTDERRGVGAGVRLCTDLAAGEKDEQRDVMPARIERVDACVTRHARDMIHCLGGVYALLPLYAQLDQPARPLVSGAPIDYDVRASRVVHVLALTRELLRNNRDDQVNLLRLRFPLVLGFILQRVSPTLLEGATLRAMQELVAAVELPELATESVMRLLLDWRLWIYAPAPTQESLLVAVGDHYRERGAALAGRFGVRWLLDAVRYFYWDVPPPADGPVPPFATAPRLHRVTQKPVGERPAREQVVRLRQLVFRIVQQLVAAEVVEQSDAVALFKCVLESHDLVVLGELLECVAQMLAPGDGGSAALLESMVSLGGAEPLLVPLQHNSDEVRCGALAVINHMLQHQRGAGGTMDEDGDDNDATGSSSSTSTPSRGSVSSPAGALKTRRRAQAVTQYDAGVARQRFASTLESALALHALSVPVARALFALLDGSGATGRSSGDADGPRSLRRAWLVPTVLSLATECAAAPATTSVAVRLVSDVARLLARADSNCAALLAHTDAMGAQWVAWFLPLLRVADESVRDFALGALAAALAYCMRARRNGWQTVDDALMALRADFGANGRDSVPTSRQLLVRVVRATRRDAKGDAPDVDSTDAQVLAANARALLLLVDEFLFADIVPLTRLRVATAGIAEATGDLASRVADGPLALPPGAPEPSSAAATFAPVRSNESEARTSDDGVWRDADAVLDAYAMAGELGLLASAESPLGAKSGLFKGGVRAMALRALPPLLANAVRTRNDRALGTTVDCMRRVLRDDLTVTANAAASAASDVSDAVLEVLRALIDVLELLPENEAAPSSLAALLAAILQRVGTPPARALVADANRYFRRGAAASVAWQPIIKACEAHCSSSAAMAASATWATQLARLARDSFAASAGRLRADALAARAERQRRARAADSDAVLDAEAVEFDPDAAESAVPSVATNLAQLIVHGELGRVRERFNGMLVRRFGAGALTSGGGALQPLWLYLADNDRLAASLWHRQLRSLTNERAPWANAADSADESRLTAVGELARRWKLDKTENYSRMRIKLKRDFVAQSYAGCAQDMMTTVAAAAAAAAEPEQSSSSSTSSSQQQQQQQQQLSGIALSAIVASDDNDAAATTSTSAAAAASASVVDETAAAAAALSTPLSATPLGKDDNLIYATSCELVTPMRSIPGTLEIHSTYLYFREDPSASAVADAWASGRVRRGQSAADVAGPLDETRRIKEKRWPLNEIREVHMRRYLLRRSALEIFLLNQTNSFLNFSVKERPRVYKYIVDAKPPNLAYTDQRSPEEILRKSDLTRQWQERQISNFEYLMQLNTIAGRTYNDLTQYPVFPWVLSDYTSQEIDLDDASVYRDLSKPVGALNPSRLKQFVERYEGFESPDIPKFHYGSHYSSAGTVIFYNLRLEPFTKFAIDLQGGQFDKPDRLFDSLPQTWDNCLTSMSDVKELVPEFFYQPEIFRNSNRIYLGRKQTGRAVDDVILPPWAKSPEDFVRINREALESEHVSAHLHEWIDLIFGYKQRGAAAVEAANVFYFLTYEGMVDIDAIKDEAERRATEAQINNFGQTPVQLLKKPHPPRHSLRALFEQSGADAVPQQLFARPEQLHSFFVQLGSAPLTFVGAPHVGAARHTVYLGGGSDVLVTVDAARIVAMHRWLPHLATSPNTPFTLDVDPALSARRPLAMLDSSPSMAHHAFTLSPDGKVLVSGAHWDNTVKLIDLDTCNVVQSLRAHKDVVSCVALASDGRTLVSGSVDTTVVIWELSRQGGAFRVAERPLHVLHGHDDEVTALAVNVELDLCVSGSKDGTCMLHTVRQGGYVRSIYHPSGLAVTLLALASDGRIVMYSAGDLVVRMFTVNARPLATSVAVERLSDMRVTADAQHLVSGGVQGAIVVRRMADLSVVYRYRAKSNIHCLTLATPERQVLVGLGDGKLLLMARRESDVVATITQNRPRASAVGTNAAAGRAESGGSNSGSGEQR
jgi:hypothetical protein